jgi:hypothetical protein
MLAKKWRVDMTDSEAQALEIELSEAYILNDSKRAAYIESLLADYYNDYFNSEYSED